MDSMTKELTKNQKEFAWELGRLDLRVSDIQKAINKLKKMLCVAGSDKLIIGIIRDWLVVNLYLIFFHKNGNGSFSLHSLQEKYEKDFPEHFFDEYTTKIKEVRKEYSTSLNRIKRNRDLNFAHLGESEKLGFSGDFIEKQARSKGDFIKKHITKAEKEDLLWIYSAEEFLGMDLIMDFQKTQESIDMLKNSYLNWLVIN